jgi:hypothetical protein
MKHGETIPFLVALGVGLLVFAGLLLTSNSPGAQKATGMVVGTASGLSGIVFYAFIAVAVLAVFYVALWAYSELDSQREKIWVEE